MATPIAFVVFNRPEVTRQTFARIREQQPERLYIIADGPRPGHPTDSERCAAVRDIVSQVDWPCEVQRDFAGQNLGCKRRVSSGITWVFEHEERAIVLEDDCVPHQDFFDFCDELLERYADDPRVAAITGDNFQRGNKRGDASYYFSKYNHVWGWATWRRAWAQYDGSIEFWDKWRQSPEWLATMPDSIERKYWERIFNRVAAGEIDSWAYPWIASTLFARGITATPNANLVTNVGFGPEATHTTAASQGLQTSASALGPISHPDTVQVDTEADRYAFDHHFGGERLRSRRRPIGFIRWLVTGTFRTLKRKLRAVR